MNTSRAEGQKLIIERTFDAPRAAVWKAWTTPEGFASWYGSPGKVNLDTVELDVRPGGKWKITSYDENGEYPFVGTYREVEEPEKLVLAFEGFYEDDKVELVTVSLEEVDGKTKMTFSQEGHLPEDEYAVGLTAGWGGFFDALDAVTAKS